MIKNPAANAGDARGMGSIPGLGSFPGGGKWQPTSIFLPEKFHATERLSTQSTYELHCFS